MNESKQTQSESPFACVMSAIAADKRESHLANAKDLFARVAEIRELNDGFAFRFNDAPELLAKLGEFIALERLCCPFFGFTIEVEPEGGAVWLRLTGREGVKPFIQAEIGEFLVVPIGSDKDDGIRSTHPHRTKARRHWLHRLPAWQRCTRASTGWTTPSRAMLPNDWANSPGSFGARHTPSRNTSWF